jgi:serine/threonine-protein kinase
VTTSTTLGSYRLVAELGHGGMADVYLAVQQGPAGSGFSKLAVVKKLRENLAEDPDFVAMLMDEARITARLSHPNVVQLFEVGQEKETYFLAIEYLEGQPLHRIARRAKKERVDVPPELYYAIVSDVLAGLHHAHDLADYDGSPLEIVHRDVTPHNIFVTYNGAVKVVDFGIAKAMGRATETKQGIVKGKVPYMSPEQVSGGKVDRRTDIFAAGVILWNSATGMKLWADLDEVGIVRALCSGRYDASPRSICPDVPEEIDAICRKSLAFKADDRYATAADMRADLEAYLGRGGATARKQLETLMKELFAPERMKLRSVLEQARLATTVSADAFAAATASPSARQLDSAPPPPQERTQLMPNAPLRPDAPAPSIAASLPGGSARPARIDEPRIASPPAARARTNVAVAAVVALVAIAGVGAVLALGRGSHAADGEADEVDRRPSAFAPELTPIDRAARGRALPGAASATESPSPSGGAAGLSTSTHRPSGSRVAPAPTTAEPKAPRPGTTSERPGGKRPPKPLDDADPWRGGGAD